MKLARWIRVLAVVWAVYLSVAIPVYCGASGGGVVSNVGQLVFSSQAAPSLSASGQASVYFDSTANALEASQNGGAYALLQTVVMPPSIASIPGCSGWFAADSLSQANASSVTTWPNLAPGPASSLSGQTSPPVTATGPTFPTYRTNVVNGLPVVRFAGASCMAGSLPSISGGGPDATTFVVMSPTSLANSYTAIFAMAGSAPYSYFVKSSGKTSLYTSSSNYDGSGAVTLVTGTFYVLTVETSFGSGALTQVGVTADFTSGAQVAWQPTPACVATYVGADSAFSGRILTGDLAELIFYSRALSSAERSTVISYLRTKYAL